LFLFLSRNKGAIIDKPQKTLYAIGIEDITLILRSKKYKGREIMRIKILAILLIAGVLLFSGCVSDKSGDTIVPSSTQTEIEKTSSDGQVNSGTADTDNTKETAIDGVTVKGLNVVSKYWQDETIGESDSKRLNIKPNIAYVKVYPKQPNQPETINIYFYVNKNDISNIEMSFGSIVIKNIQSTGKILYADVAKNNAGDYYSIRTRYGKDSVDRYLWAGEGQLREQLVGTHIEIADLGNGSNNEYISIEINANIKGT